MMKFGVFALIVALCGVVQAKWYWPLGTDVVDEKPKRVSELVEPASRLIDEATDLASEGKSAEAVEVYRKALAELERIERENADRVKGTEFATLRNKRAYVNAAIDSMLLSQVRENARAVAVSDTAELEKRLDRERWGKRLDKVTELVDCRKTEAAMAELERARAGTTNAVLIAVTEGVVAGVYCQQGAFGDACRALAQSRQELSRASSMTDEERRLVSECLQSVRMRIVDGHGKSIAAGRRACEACAKLEVMDLSSSNAVALAGGVVASIGDLQRNMSAFALPAAELSRDSSNLQSSVSLLLKQMMAGKKGLVWDADAIDFELALDAFGDLAPEIKNVDSALSAVLELVERRPNRAGEGEAQAGARQVRSPAADRTPRALTKREQAMVAITKGDFVMAEKIVQELLDAKPNGAMALNLKAALEARQGKYREAEATLDRAIRAHPRNHFAYYNMANLMLQSLPEDNSIAKRYYEAGRRLGGPVDARLEEALK